MAKSVTRREALKKFGVGLAGVALASLGLANRAQADPHPQRKCSNSGCYKYCLCFCSGGGPGGC